MTDLLLPLSALPPGPVPVGLPVVDRDGLRGVVTRPPVSPLVVVMGEQTGGLQRLVDLSLDLTPDPSRVDALPAVASMVARACGLDASGGVIWHAAFIEDRGWIVTVSDGGACRRFTGADVPALADIDPAHPHADRLALIAVVLQAPWRARD